MLYQIAPNEVIRISDTESRKIFACGIRNPELWNTEYSSRDPESYKGLESRIQVPLKKCAIKYLESGIYGVESRIQDCLGSPFMVRIKCQTYRKEVIFQTE